MSLSFSQLRHGASLPLVASAPLYSHLAQVSAALGISLQEGREMESILEGLAALPIERLSPEHQTIVENLRRGGDVDLRTVLPVLESLAGSAPLTSLPAVRLMTDRPVSRDRILLPPQGGVSVRTSEGLIQFGTGMWLNNWVNEKYQRAGGNTLPRDRVRHQIPIHFIVDAGFSGPEVGMIPLDFLRFMGFIVKDTTFTFVVDDPEQAKTLKRYLDLTYLGNRSPSLSERVRGEYSETALAVPDLLAEIERGFKTPDPESLSRIDFFDPSGGYRIGEVFIRRLGSQRYEVLDRGLPLGIVDLKKFPPRASIRKHFQKKLSHASRSRLAEVRQMAIKEGRTGLWPLGTSDGFDPKGTTSGFMIWNEGRAVLVDPPSHTLDYLIANQIPLDRIDGVIITHGHTDHFNDAIGKLIRKIPNGRLYTTPTIYEMLSEQFELSLGYNGLGRWPFVPVIPAKRSTINGLEFQFDYTFHNVPAIGFEIWRYGDLLLYFSGDTLTSQDVIEQMTEEGPLGLPPVMNPFRAFEVLRHQMYLSLSTFLSTPPVILMDAGLPPTHGSSEELLRMIQEGKAVGGNMSRVLVYHLSDKRAQKDGLPKWREGHEGWIELPPLDGGRSPA